MNRVTDVIHSFIQFILCQCFSLTEHREQVTIRNVFFWPLSAKRREVHWSIGPLSPMVATNDIIVSFVAKLFILSVLATFKTLFENFIYSLPCVHNRVWLYHTNISLLCDVISQVKCLNLHSNSDSCVYIARKEHLLMGFIKVY